MLFLPANQNLEKSFYNALYDIITQPKNVKDEVEGAYQAFLYNGSHIFFDTDRELSLTEKEELLKRYNVKGVVISNSESFQAELFIGEESDGVMQELNC